MKTVVRFCALAIVAMALTASAFAGECCVKTSAAVKAGKACEKCSTGACCKETAKNLATKGEAKSCEKCAAKK